MKRFPFWLAVLGMLLLASPVAGQTWIPGAIEFSRLAGFGQSIVIDGNQVIATRTGESVMFPSPASQKGGVFIFSDTETGWQQVYELVPDDIEIGDRFGHAAVLSGDLLAVSAPGANKGCGAIILFERADRVPWEAVGRLENNGCEMDERMGWSMAFVGDKLYAGAPGNDERSGAVHVFQSENESWFLAAQLDSPEANTAFGESLAAQGSMLFVGAPNAADGAGQVYVYARDATTPVQTLASEDESVRLFGLEIAVDGNRMLVAAPGLRAREISGGRPVAGKVFLFGHDDVARWTSTSILELALSPDQPPHQAYGYGTAIALQGNEAWIGAPFGGSGAGAVYTYDLTRTGWENTQVLATRPLAVGAGFGGQLAFKDDLGVVGAIRADFGEGRGVVFTRTDDTWEEQHPINDAGRGLEAMTGSEMRCLEGKVDQFDCEEVDLLSFLPIDDVGGGRGVIVNDVWGWTDPQTKREYAVVGRSNGTSFIDVTDPSNPVYVADLPATVGSSPNAWRDVKVHRDHVYVVADNVGKHGMQVFDMRELRNLEDVPATVEATALYDKVYSAHNVVVDEALDHVYIVAASGGGETCGAGYHMVDVSDPADPTFAGCFSDPSAGAGGNHIHDAQCVIYDGPDEDHRGKEICFGANASVFSIADVSDKKDPKTLSALDYPNVAYVHQGWLTEDQRYFYINDEGDEVGGLTPRTRTLIWDVEDLDDPVFVKAHLGTTAASDHNFYIRGNLMYQSNYVSGLQILDISDPLNPTQVGSFDTVPWGENAPGFAGSWSNYPYFESGTIVVSSITEGVFLVRKTPRVMP
ncbi:MAG: choice-of-anchor B family protein [Bacteroidota bacterium]